jgi:hypothetical protein
MTWKMGDITWHAGEWEAKRGKVEHLLREAWRKQTWESFKASKRREVDIFRATGELGYSEARSDGARKLYRACGTTASARKVMEGGAISTQIVNIWRGEREKLGCPFCGNATVVPCWTHLAWECTGCADGRPRRPISVMQQRWGWPLTAKVTIYDKLVLQYLGLLRLLVLAEYRKDIGHRST